MPGEVNIPCEVVDTELDRSPGNLGDGISAAALRHISGCDRCFALYGFIATPSRGGATAPALRPAVIAGIRKSLTPVRPLPSTPVRTVRFLLVFCVIALLLVSMMAAQGYTAMKWWQLLMIAGVLTGAAIVLSVSLAWQMAPGSLRRIAPRNAVAILLVAFATAVAFLFPWQIPESFLRPGLHCLGAGSMMAIPATFLFGILVWRGAPLSLGPLGATLGALAGLVSVTVLQFTCGLQDAAHLLVWHGGILLLTSLAGAWLGQRIDKSAA